MIQFIVQQLDIHQNKTEQKQLKRTVKIYKCT